jgi:hypothetical protein
MRPRLLPTVGKVLVFEDTIRVLTRNDAIEDIFDSRALTLLIPPIERLWNEPEDFPMLLDEATDGRFPLSLNFDRPRLIACAAPGSTRNMPEMQNMTEGEAVVFLLQYGITDPDQVKGDVLEIASAVNAGTISNFEGRVRTIARALGVESGPFKLMTSKQFFDLLMKILPAVRALAVIEKTRMLPQVSPAL